jgi:uncharacterized protein
MTHTRRQLRELDQALSALEQSIESMNVSEFDGFVAGLIVCPEIVMPTEWLPMIFGGDELPEIDSLDVFQASLDAVMAHYNRVARDLSRPRPRYEALLDQDGEEILWEPWISGFERAMRLRPDSWLAFVECQDEEIRMTLPLILELHAINQGTSELGEEAVTEMDAVAPSLIPTMVLNLNRFTKDLKPASSRETNAPAKAKPGRNEPCLCGSGRKYKKCCGAVTLH